MERRDFVKQFGLGFISLVTSAGCQGFGSKKISHSSKNRCPGKRPNIVWIMAEDCSKHWYNLFDSDYGKRTPNIESMADSGLIFDNAYCNVAVCSAARSALITGCNPSRVGVQWHRSSTAVDLSNSLSAFPVYLRDAGYYTTNSTKTDYNCKVTDAWDNVSSEQFGWRHRPSKDTPFFHVRTFYGTHESAIQNKDQIAKPNTDLASIRLYPVHPDTALFRQTYATYFDRIKEADDYVGTIIEALQADGVLEDTFIFFFGDNGGTVPGSKGYIVNTGLHIPLVVRIPENWKHFSPLSPGHRVEGFVSFEDFGPTVLNLAGLEKPTQMNGKSFLGPDITLSEINARDEAFSSADRFDEMYNLCRSLQKGRFKYVRNYEPFYPYALYNQYRYKMEAMKEWKKLYDDRRLDEIQSLFFERRYAEELYDIVSDPFETKNLAADPAYTGTLLDLRKRLYQYVTRMPDLGILPEAVFLKEGGMNNPIGYGQANQARIQHYVDIAELMLEPYNKVSAELKRHLASADPLDRFWALTVCAAFGKNALEMHSEINSLAATENNPFVLARAAVFLGESGLPNSPVDHLLKKALQCCGNKTESLAVLNDAVHLQDTLGYNFNEINNKCVVGNSSWINRRIDHLGW